MTLGCGVEVSSGLYGTTSRESSQGIGRDSYCSDSARQIQRETIESGVWSVAVSRCSPKYCRVDFSFYEENRPVLHRHCTIDQTRNSALRANWIVVVEEHFEEVSACNLGGSHLIDADVIPLGPVPCCCESDVVRSGDVQNPRSRFKRVVLVSPREENVSIIVRDSCNNVCVLAAIPV